MLDKIADSFFSDIFKYISGMIFFIQISFKYIVHKGSIDSGAKPLFESMLITFYDMWRHCATNGLWFHCMKWDKWLREKACSLSVVRCEMTKKTM